MNELFRRAAPGVALAGVALSSVWLFDPALHATRAAADQGQAGDASTDAAAPAQPDPSTSDSAQSDSSTTTPDSNAGSSAQEPASSDCADPTAVTGAAAMTRWGPVQVQMEFAADGTVCSVGAIAYPDGDQHSATLNSQAIPYLDAQAVRSGVAFDTFSGATYTSEAYRESMQSILDRR